MSDPPESLDSTYREYERSGRATDRWSGANPGNRAIHAERNAAFERLLGDHARERSIPRLLEVGCGAGALLSELAAMPALRQTACFGVDLLAFRLESISASGGELRVAQADGQSLPFPSSTFEVVVLSTVLSSVPNRDLAHHITTEVDRVLLPKGRVLWYDMRYPNPSNRHVRPLSRMRVKDLFPGYEADLRSTTLVPQLARRLGRITDRVYPVLAGLPFARSHLIGQLTRPS